MPLIIVNGKTKNVTWAEFYAQSGGPPPVGGGGGGQIGGGTLGTPITPSPQPQPGPNIPAPVVPVIRPLSAGPVFDDPTAPRPIPTFAEPVPAAPSFHPFAGTGPGFVNALGGGPAFDTAPKSNTPRPAHTALAELFAKTKAFVTGEATLTRQVAGLEQPGDVKTETLEEIINSITNNQIGTGSVSGPNTITGTGPSDIQLGNPAQTLGDLNGTGIFPPGTQFNTATSSAGGTSTAVLPDGRIVDLTRVETYGQLVAESLFRAIATGNMDLRSTNIREEWAMSFKHLWEDEFENVSEFLTFYGYRQVPGTNNWIRQNISDPGSPSFGGGGQLPPVVFRTARGGGGGGGGGFGGGTAARGRVSGLGLVNWRI